MNHRIIFSQNGTLTDISASVEKFTSASVNFNYEAGTDYLFIGARMPFNNLYIRMDHVSHASSVMTVEYWDGSAWVEVVDLMDGTNGCGQSGMVQFTPNKYKPWMCESTNDQSQTVTGLESVVIYDKYWLRISFSADLTADPLYSDDVTIKWIGNIFSDDEDLSVEFPDLVRGAVMNSFKQGKADWQEQHAKAASVIVTDLINKNIIIEKGQILDWREFRDASVQKCAEIIFNAFGDDYVDQLISAKKEYNERLSKRLNRVDNNKNAVEEVDEVYAQSGFLTR